MADARPSCIAHWRDVEGPDDNHYPGDDELLSLGAPFGRHFGLTRLGIHHERLPPGRRTSYPHAESAEQEFVYVIEGEPDVWLDGRLHRLRPGDAVGFPAGTGLCHSFLNNTAAEVRLLVVGETAKPENRIVYPRNPDRKPLREDWWHDAPARDFGDHDGLTDLERARKAAKAAPAMTALDLADLDRLYPAPKPRSVAKVIDHVDRHAARFIALSPFCVFATAGADGAVDASPRGGAPGFVRVDGPRRLLMPDRPGNNRLDSYRNILSGAGEVGMLFFIPGIDDALRLNGRASLTDDPALLETMIEFGKAPRAVVEIAVREVYLHCPKAMMRARLWDTAVHQPREALPSLGEMIRDQTGLGEAETTAEALARYKDQL